MAGSPRFAEFGINLARRNGHKMVDFSAGSLQFRVSRRVLVVWHSRVKLRTRRGGDICGHALDVGLRQLAGRAGTE
jgi:hypothetical protein